MTPDTFDQKRYKEILLATFEAFICFCTHHNIRFVAAYGTALGAVRHQGLIPWDDDIDVIMDRDNYNRFLALRTSKDLGNYEIRCYHDHDYPYPFAKFCDASTTVMESVHDRFYQCVYGVYVDIFPVDEIDNEDRARQLRKRYHRITYNFERSFLRILPQDTSQVLPALKKLFYRMISPISLWRMERMERRISRERGDRMLYYRSILSFEKSVLKKEWVYDTIEVPYEHLVVPIPRDYDTYLTLNYGDYMTPPPHEQRVQHNHSFVDLNKRLSVAQCKCR